MYNVQSKGPKGTRLMDASLDEVNPEDSPRNYSLGRDYSLGAHDDAKMRESPSYKNCLFEDPF